MNTSNKIKDLNFILPCLGEASTVGSTVWKSTFDIGSKAYFISIFHEIYSRQKAILNCEGIDALESLTIKDMKNCSNLIDSCTVGSDLEIALCVIQTHLSFVPLEYFSVKKELVNGMKWISYGIGKNWNFPDDHEMKIFNNMGDAYSSFSFAYPEVVACWFGYFYYIWRSLGCDYIIGDSQVNAAVDAINALLAKNNIQLWALNFGYLACWLASHDHSEASNVIRHLENSIESDVVDIESKITILEILSTRAGRFSSRSPNQWAQYSLTKYHGRLTTHQKLFFSSNAIEEGNHETYVEYYEIFIDSLKQKVSEINHVTTPSIDIEYSRSKLADIVNPVLCKLMKLRCGESALDVMHIWHGGDFNYRDTVLMFANDSEGMLYCGIDRELNTTLKRKEGSHQKLIQAMNRFHGIYCSITGMKDLTPFRPENGRFGVPDEGHSIIYEESMVEYFQIEGWVFLPHIGRMIFSPYHNCPIQFVCKKYKNLCLPLHVSLVKSKVDREIIKVAIFSGANSITEESEIELLKSIFSAENQRIEFTVFLAENSPKEAFIREYGSNYFDVIWVMSHGNFDHWSPKTMCFSIGDEGVSIEDLIDLRINSNKRRLLFLNICDGATSQNTDSISRIGMAPSIACAEQCVISHLWPIMPYAALAFSGCLAINLLEEQEFFKAYEASLSDMLKGKAHIIAKFESYIGDNHTVIDRIKNSNVLFETLAHGGSAAFFE
jgi:hypothetical protein